MEKNLKTEKIFPKMAELWRKFHEYSELAFEEEEKP
jgi:metal-dependent amidase/aminoacylase/carboxypeptidase family protein